VKKILICAGTRPEVIKLAPLYHELKKSNFFFVQLVLTGQHRELLSNILEFFEITPDFNLDVMSSGQNLSLLTSKIITGIDDVLSYEKPDLVIVHGDTTTALAVSISSFYHRIKIAHVEAGLRTNNMEAPWPEEANRQIIGRLADYHFCPTDFAKFSLLKENPVSSKVYVTGNTVIDSLYFAINKINHEESQKFFFNSYNLDLTKKYVLVTAHRRENIGEDFRNVFLFLKSIATTSNLSIVFPVHLNPAVKDMAYSILSGHENVYLLPPQSYDHFISLLSKCSMVLTDSGGVQEEALSFNVPVLIMREFTERPEGLSTGIVHLVGTNTERILSLINEIFDRNETYCVANPYGDGKASIRIRDILEKEL
jgi:UDP-N-acetylglucosamine 2-epimerase (non-hydrolysing)